MPAAQIFFDGLSVSLRTPVAFINFPQATTIEQALQIIPTMMGTRWQDHSSVIRNYTGLHRNPTRPFGLNDVATILTRLGKPLSYRHDGGSWVALSPALVEHEWVAHSAAPANPGLVMTIAGSAFGVHRDHPISPAIAYVRSRVDALRAFNLMAQAV